MQIQVAVISIKFALLSDVANRNVTSERCLRRSWTELSKDA